MLRNFLIVFFIILSPCILYAGELSGIVKDNSGEIIIGANLRWIGKSSGGVSGEDGRFSIPRATSDTKLIVSYIGYNTDTIEIKVNSKFEEIILSGGAALEEVVVTHRSVGLLHSRVETIQTQKINREELGRAACCNLAESFTTNPSVDVSYSDAVTGARQIRLLGLSGTYVQMLTEQVPHFRGAAGLYGLNYVPGPWMESIQVSKGTSSVKNGYEALTGQINIEYKKPQNSDPLTLNLFAADNGRIEFNGDGNYMIRENLGVGLMAHYSNDKQGHDSNHDGFLDLPKTEQVNLLNRWYFKSDKWISQTVLNGMFEDRISGESGHNDDLSAELYKVNIETWRGNIYTKNGYILDPLKNSSFALILSGSIHDQRSLYGYRIYDVNHGNMYASLLYETEFTRQHHFSSGLSFNYDGYKERYGEKINEESVFPWLRRTESTPGAYVQYTYNRNDEFVVLLGLRGDYHNRYGFFVTPRLHLKYDIAPFLTFRASAGKGYRPVNEWMENSYLLASNRQFVISPDLNRWEEAWNFGANLSSNLEIGGKNLSVNLDWYYTRFIKQVVADLEQAHEVRFYNLEGRSYAQSAQLEMSYPFFRGFTFTGAFRFTDVKTTYSGVLREKPLTSRYKAMATASYQTRLKKWQFDLTAAVNGPGRMPDPDMTVADESLRWKKNYKAYILLNAQVTKNFRTWSVYAGGENLTNYKQKNPIIDASNPWGAHFDASMIYAPVHGAKFYVGIRWNIPKY